MGSSNGLRLKQFNATKMQRAHLKKVKLRGIQLRQFKVWKSMEKSQQVLRNISYKCNTKKKVIHLNP